jgi:hypothetical protein
LANGMTIDELNREKSKIIDRAVANARQIWHEQMFLYYKYVLYWCICRTLFLRKTKRREIEDTISKLYLKQLEHKRSWSWTWTSPSGVIEDTLILNTRYYQEIINLWKNRKRGVKVIYCLPPCEE